MKTFRPIDRRGRASSLLRNLAALAAAGLLGVGAGCKGSNNIAGPPSATADIAGAWTGTYDPPYVTDCGVGLPVQVSFTVDGHNVVGTLSATGPYDCGFQNAVFQGTIQGNSIRGSVTGSRDLTGAFVDGNVPASDRIEFTFGFDLLYRASMHLHR